MTPFKFARTAVFACAAALAIGAAEPADAAVIVSFEKVGLDVIATLSGTINFGSAANSAHIATGPSYGINPAGGSFGALDAGTNTRRTYASAPAAPFGTGGYTAATTYVGDAFVVEDNRLWTDQGFVSGGILSGTMTFAGASFASLGLTPGANSTATYPNDTVTFVVADVPVPAALPMLGLGLGALGLIGARRRRRAA
jgi:hypothetical protein